MSPERIVELVQYGTGGVGQALMELVAQNGRAIAKRLGVDLRYRALADSRSVMHLKESEAITPGHIQHIVAGFRAGEKLGEQPGAVQKPDDLAVLATELDRLKGESKQARLIVVDVSAAEANLMTPVLTAALRQGQRVVLANKRPLCGSYAEFTEMLGYAGAGGARLRYETTVGAALPIISTLGALLDSQDTIERISGTFSGTLGYLVTRLEEGIAYSQAVREAKELGYTEPDPRDDLGGVDVARKALILARTMGYPLEMNDIAIQSLYPADMAENSVPGFMERLPEQDEAFARRFEYAKSDGVALRYAANVQDGKVRVGLEGFDIASALGRLKGTNNMVVFQSKRYHENPLVVQGPGAGAEITASGVLADILSLSR